MKSRHLFSLASQVFSCIGFRGKCLCLGWGINWIVISLFDSLAGTLNGSMYTAQTAGFSESAKSAKVPHKLALPAPIRSIR